MSKKAKYWYCIIGPIPGSNIPSAADCPPRHAAREAIERITGCDTCRCTSSGWITKEEATMLQDASTHYLNKHYKG